MEVDEMAQKVDGRKIRHKKRNCQRFTTSASRNVQSYFMTFNALNKQPIIKPKTVNINVISAK